MATERTAILKDPLGRTILGLPIGFTVLFIILYAVEGTGVMIAETAWYVPAMHALTGLLSITVAFLSLGRHEVVGDSGSFWIGLSCGGFGILSIFYVVTWPGIRGGGQGLLARLPGPPGWMAILELATLGLGLIAAATLVWPRRGRTSRLKRRTAIGVGYAAVTFAAVLILLIHEAMPALLTDRGVLTPLLLSLDWLFLLLYGVGAGLSTRRYRRTGDSLFGYVAITQISLAFVIITALIGAERYDIWYYLSRLVLVGGFGFLLFGLLETYAHLLRREAAKAADAELYYSELQAVLQGSPDAILVTDAAGKLSHANGAGLSLLGLDQSEEAYASAPRWETLLPFTNSAGETFSGERHPALVVTDGGYLEGEEVLLKSPGHGEPAWYRLSGGPISTTSGAIKGGILVASDISEQKRAEAAIRRSEERLKKATSIDSVGVLFFDMESNFLDANDTFLRMIGYGREELERGELKSDRVTLPKWMPRTYEVFQELLELGRFSPYAKELVRPDGSHWWGLFAGARIDEDEAVEFIIDITERVKAEEALRREREFLGQITDLSPICITQVDAEGRIVFANPAAEEVLGIAPQDVERRSFNDPAWRITDLNGSPFPEEELPFVRVKESLKPVRNIQHAIVWPDGTRRYVLVNAAPILGEDGTFEGMVSTIEDVTERKEVERQREAAIEAKQQLMQELNHRVKNNLNMVSSLVSLKDESLGPAADLSDIRGQVTTIAYLHEKLYESESVTTVALEPYLRDLLTDIFSFYPGNSVNLSVDIGDCSMAANRATTLGLVLNEIATNAMKHGFIATEDPWFKVSVQDEEKTERRTVTVTQNGGPIPEDVDLSDSGSSGLHLMDVLVTQLQGTLEFERSPSPTFRIRIPLES